MRAIGILVFVLLAACSGETTGLFGQGTEGPERTVDVTQLPPMRVTNVTVVVPETLLVSEENSYKPVADIVWRGDPFGDRYEQVQDIIKAAAELGVSQMRGDLAVDVNIEVTRFHAITEKTRYSIGGVHEISFLLTATNSDTGEVVIPTYQVNSELDAFGGDQAIEADRMGLTQKHRISQFISSVILKELTGMVPVEPAANAG